MLLDNQSFEFCGLKHLSLANFSNAKIVIYPQEHQQCLLPFCFTISLKNNNITTNYPNLKICKVTDIEYVVILNEQFCGEQILFNKDNYLITNGLQAYYNNKNVCNERFYANFCENFVINNINFFSISSFGKLNKNNNLLFAFNKDKLVLKKQFISLEVSNNQITLLTDQQDSLNHGIVSSYLIEDDNVVLREEYSVYLNKDKLSCLNEINCVNAFLDCGICGNINLIQKFASPLLMQNFSLENFKGFFSNPTEYLIFSSKENQSKAIVFNQNGYNIFTFALQENIIIKIEKA